MAIIRRLATAAICALTLAAGSLATAPTASATVGQKTCGTRVYASMPLCLKEYSNGYEISYYNNTGTTLHLDFNLNCSSGRYGDEGDFISYPGWTSYYFFAVGVKSWCQGGMYDYGMNYWHWTRTLSG